jgi:aspartate aminotransferase
MRDRFEARHDHVHDQIRQLPGFDCPPGYGAFYLFPRINDALAAAGFTDDVALCEALLEDTGVALVPGTAFGAPGHLRVSFAAAEATMDEAVARIRHFIETRSSTATGEISL